MIFTRETKINQNSELEDTVKCVTMNPESNDIKTTRSQHVNVQINEDLNELS